MSRSMLFEGCRFIYLFIYLFIYFGGSVWKIDGIALCQPRAVQVPADWLSLLCSKKGNYNVNVSQQESEPGKHGRQKVDGESGVTVG